MGKSKNVNHELSNTLQNIMKDTDTLYDVCNISFFYILYNL